MSNCMVCAGCPTYFTICITNWFYMVYAIRFVTICACSVCHFNAYGITNGILQQLTMHIGNMYYAYCKCVMPATCILILGFGFLFFLLLVFECRNQIVLFILGVKRGNP